MDECEDAFINDEDINPQTPVDSSSAEGIPSQYIPSRKRKMSAYQEERLKLKREEAAEKKEYRASLLATLNRLVDKF